MPVIHILGVVYDAKDGTCGATFLCEWQEARWTSSTWDIMELVEKSFHSGIPCIIKEEVEQNRNNNT